MTIYLIDYVLPRIIQDFFGCNTRAIMVGDPLTKNDFDIKGYSSKYGVPIMYMYDELYVPNKNTMYSSFNNMSTIIEDAANRIIHKLYHGENVVYTMCLRYYDPIIDCDLKLKETQEMIISDSLGNKDIIPYYRILLLNDKRRIYDISDDQRMQLDPYYRLKDKFRKEIYKN